MDSSMGGSRCEMYIFGSKNTTYCFTSIPDTPKKRLKDENNTRCSTNLVGKFTQSVRRIVQDVKDEGTATGASKEEVIDTNERLRAVRVRMDESYDTAKKALVGLMGKYNESKSVHNIFQRYNMLKAMIKVIVLSINIKNNSSK
uniref:Uncharacterized protein LOC114344680 n=1 Tax=Diabrotica virgifera virgifera TaxID=50390 RepID=A0A6P7GYW1_DIAVI